MIDQVNDQDVYEELRRPLMRFAASLVGPDSAGDIVSEVVVATLQRRPLSSIENPQAYLMKAVLNRAKSRGLRLERERRAVAQLGFTSGLRDYSEPADSDFVDLVISLPPRQRAAVYLVYWEDLSPSEAAALLDVRPATLRRYLHLAHRKLRRRLDE